MARIRIDDMRLQVPRLDRQEAAQFGQRVAAELVKLAPSMPQRDLSRLRIRLNAAETRSPAAIAAAIRRSLR